MITPRVNVNELLLVTSNSSKAIGRPRTITEGDMYELMRYFKKGYSVSLACVKSGVPRSVFYAEMKRNEDFRDKITATQDTMTNRATSIIDRALHHGDIDVAMWLIDRNDRCERNAQRAKEFRLVKKLTVTKTKTYQETEAVELEVDTR